MDTNSILVKDTDGHLQQEEYKNYPDKAALSVWFDYTATHQALKFSANNVRYDSLPDIHAPSTYITFLTYNGTMGYDNRVFSTVLKKDVGNYSGTDVPVPILTFQPHEYIANTQISDAAEDVLEIIIYS